MHDLISATDSQHLSRHSIVRARSEQLQEFAVSKLFCDGSSQLWCADVLLQPVHSLSLNVPCSVGSQWMPFHNACMTATLRATRPARPLSASQDAQFGARIVALFLGERVPEELCSHELAQGIGCTIRSYRNNV